MWQLLCCNRGQASVAHRSPCEPPPRAHGSMDTVQSLVCALSVLEFFLILFFLLLDRVGYPWREQLGKGTFWNSPKVNQTTKGWFKFRDEQEGEHGSGHLSFSFRFTAELDKAAQTEMVYCQWHNTWAQSRCCHRFPPNFGCWSVQPLKNKEAVGSKIPRAVGSVM
jgi:hypothetical protein